MAYATPHLPDPVDHPAFYSGVVFKRLVAFGIDTLAILALTVPIILLTGFLALFFLVPLVAVIGFVYRWATLASGSATWGMRLMAIEFRDSAGQRLDGNLALMHTVAFTVSWAVFPVQAVSVLMMLIDDRGRGLTDLLLGTVALNRRA